MGGGWLIKADEGIDGSDDVRCTIVKISLSRMHGNENSQPPPFPLFIEKTISYKKKNLDEVPH